MKKSFYWVVALLLLSAGILSSCDETEVVDRYANWKVRNEFFLDSIADVAKRNESGKWERFLSYTIPGNGGTNGGLVVERGVEDYIYVEKLQEATPPARNQDGTIRETLYTDTVYVHYRGNLMNGDKFDSSYSETDLDYEVAVPAEFSVNGLVDGFTTALQHMHMADSEAKQDDGTDYDTPWQYRGDRWRVYIPYQLGYGTLEKEGIPAHSVLVFDIALVRAWHVGERVPAWN